MIKITFLFLTNTILISLLYGCGMGVPGSLPPERPEGVISGMVMDGNVTDTEVTVYAFSDGVRGEVLGSGVVDEAGNFNIGIRSSNKPILIEARGGAYIEQTTKQIVKLSDDQFLQAITEYESGKSLNIAITPLSHIAVALIIYKMNKGILPAKAISESYDEVSLLFNVEIDKTRVVDITIPDETETSLNDELLYGFYLAGISNFSLWASNENQVTPHTIYTSISLSQIFYNDIKADGLLDGVGLNNESKEPIPLGFGVVALDTETYRRIFSLHLLAVANNDINKTNIDVNHLTEVVNAMALGEKQVLGKGQIFIEDYSPVLSLIKGINPIHSGTLILNIKIEGFLGSEKLILFVDDQEIIRKETPSSTKINVIIDTADFTDDKHTIRIEAIDALGKSGSLSLEMLFDNTNPIIALTSALATNEVSFEVSGLYADNAAGVETILIQDKEASLFEDGSWSATVELEPGENIIPIEVVDRAGNRRFLQGIILLDNFQPIISTMDKHSKAKFSTLDGKIVIDVLEDENIEPIQIMTNKLSLNGTSISREALDNSQISYFAFNVSDQITSTEEAESGSILVLMQYEINDVVLTPWRALTEVNGEFIIPLTLETLSPEWVNSTLTDLHTIKVTVTDAVGNQTNKQFKFKLDISVPEMEITQITDEALGLFDNTNFADRALLNEKEFISTSYVFTNTSVRPIWINLADDTQHNVEQILEQSTKTNMAEVKKTTQWRVGYMDPLIECPDIAVDEGGWALTTSILNWNGDDWEERTPPVAMFENEIILSDILPGTNSSDWTSVPDFDSEHKVFFDIVGTRLFTYVYDYISNIDSNQAAYISGWFLRTGHTTESPVNKTCATPRSYLQQQVTSEYQMINEYPKTNIKDITVPNDQGFNTIGFNVVDNNVGVALNSINGWYLIPVNHEIRIEKIVKTPKLDLDSNLYYEYDPDTEYDLVLSDKSTSWHVNRHMTMSLVHGVSEENISFMSKRKIDVASGVVDYSVN